MSGVMVKLVKESKVSFLFGVDEICDLTDFPTVTARKASYNVSRTAQYFSATEGLLGTRRFVLCSCRVRSTFSRKDLLYVVLYR